MRSTSPAFRYFGLFTLLLASAAHAQEPLTTAPTDAARAHAREEEIIVRGRTRAAALHAKLQHAALSASELSAKRLDQLAITSTRQISSLTPNLYQPRATVGYSNSNYFIRGIGEIDPQGEPSVGTYIDGIYLPRAIGTLQELLDIEGLEIDRGPVGFTVGHQAEGGAIRITTTTPDAVRRFTAQAGYGTYNEWVAGLAASGPLVDDQLFGSIALNHHGRDGVDRNITLNRDENDIDYTQGRGKLRFQPNDRVEIILALDGTSDGSTNRGYGSPLYPDRLALQSIIYPKNNFSEAGFTGTVNYELNDHLSLHSISGVRGYDDVGDYDNTGDPYARTSQLLHYTDRAYSEDLRLTGDWDRFSFTAGAYYFYEDWGTNRRANNIFGLPTNVVAKIKYQPVLANIDQITRNVALYGVSQYKITPAMTATVGLRWNYEQHSNHETLNSLGPVPGFSIGVPGDLTTLFGAPVGALDWVASAGHSWNQILPKGGLSWAVAPNVAPYVSISQGGKSGGFDYRAQTPTAFGRLQAVLPYAPETVTTYELGVKSDPLPGRLMLNAALFYNSFDNIQITTRDPTSGLTHRLNAGTGHSEGAELETGFHVTQDWELNATASYLFAQLDQFVGIYPQSTYPDGLVLNNTPHSGQGLPYSPRFQADLSTNYVLPLPIPGTVRLAGDISYQTAVYTDALDNNQTRIPDQTYLNALISWTDTSGHWTATLTGKNLADRRFPQSLSFIQGGGIPVIYAASFNDPRTVFFTVRYTM